MFSEWFPSSVEVGDDGDESDMPDEKDLNEQFASLLEELELPEKLRRALGSQTDDKKWKIIRSHEESAIALQSDGKHRPWQVIAWLDGSPGPQDISEIQAAIASNPTTWLSAFFEHGGLHAFSNVLGMCRVTPALGWV